jgi:hypothetical protein
MEELDVEQISGLTSDQIDSLTTSATIDLSGISSTSAIWNTSTTGISTITLPTTTISVPNTTGHCYTSGQGLTVGSGTNCHTWTTLNNSCYGFATNNPPKVQLNENGISMEAGTDIKIGNRSLKEFMAKMEERMAILVPDPNKLEKFEALKKAYEHYKTMESLCFDEPKEEE